jgi:hypothetical protein
MMSCNLAIKPPTSQRAIGFSFKDI